MRADYKSASGQKIEFDLDAVIDVAAGYSQVRRGWTGKLIYIPALTVFVELRSSPEDFRGYSDEESEEVTAEYIQQTFSIGPRDIETIKSNPHEWPFLNLRKKP